MSKPIYSMTGFTALQREVAAGRLLLELRSVNHRYLELHVRLDDCLRGVEAVVRETIAARLVRGKTECRISLVPASGAGLPAEVSLEALQRLARLAQVAQHHFPQAAPLSVIDILRWPGVLAEDQADSEVLREEILALLEQGLQELSAAREREGARLRSHVLERVAAMRQEVARLKPVLPALAKAYQDRLAARLREVLSVDDGRIHQELALYVQKIDVDEEMVRLETHLHEVCRVLDAGGVAGKRLDFLMQELNREANTLGSKSVSTQVSQVALTLKVLIEQVREQIQNLE